MKYDAEQASKNKQKNTKKHKTKSVKKNLKPNNVKHIYMNSTNRNPCHRHIAKFLEYISRWDNEH